MDNGFRLGRLGRALAAAACCAGAGGAWAVAVSGSGPGGSIPDGSLAGVLSTVAMPNAGAIDSLSISVAVTHGFIGDLVYQLEHGGRVLTLLDRPGLPSGDASGEGDSSRLLAGAPLIFSAAGLAIAETAGAGCPAAGTVGVSAGCLNTLFLPQQSLALFIGADVGGAWTLGVFDHYGFYDGTLASWTLNADVTPALPVPEPASGTLAAAGVAAWLLRNRFKRQPAIASICSRSCVVC